jgi:hypothetical protein
VSAGEEWDGPIELFLISLPENVKTKKVVVKHSKYKNADGLEFLKCCKQQSIPS